MKPCLLPLMRTPLAAGNGRGAVPSRGTARTGGGGA